jgi:hypothetical protein
MVMLSLFPNSEAPLAGWAINHGGLLAFVTVAMVCCAWLALRDTQRGGRRADAGGDLGGSSSSDDTIGCDTSSGGECGGGDGGGGD